MPVLIGTANVQNLGVHLSDGNDLSRKDVRRCGRSVAELGVTICGMQELAEKADRADVRSGLSPTHRLLTSGNGFSELGIAYDPTLVEFLSGSLEEHLLTHGEAELEPNRYYLEAQFRRIGRKHLAPFAVGTTHTVSKAWSGAEHDREVEKHRQELWLEQWDKIGRHQRATVADGVSVFGTGDLNRAHHLPRIAPTMRVLGRNGVDWVWAVEAEDGVGFEFIEEVVKRNPSDHDVEAVRGTLLNLSNPAAA